ncbi:hypothetical protein B296_00054025 [Ensete ventricosum]|uniref:Uncharacterized protein n=1 Tax=Ensete ventricosum TaxID=4639 RepID=A0A426XM11_ENSVE|nr:hypothetical protein B296_00054025 [Ensete ventricosum]
MLTKSSDRPLSPLRIKQEGNFYARLLSKEGSLSATPSFRVYYGVSSGSVPFVWESQPGTPKATVAAAGVPPLTPPPAHFHHPRRIMATKKKKRRRASRFSDLATFLFRRLIPRKPCMPRSPLPFSAVSSLTSSPFTRLSSSNSLQRSSFSSGGDDDDDDDSDDGPARSMLCFPVQRIPRISLFRRRRDHKKTQARKHGEGSA